MAAYATIDDLIAIKGELTTQQTEQAESLLESASSKLRVIAGRYGFDLDAACEDEDYLNAVKDTVLSCVRRALESYGSDTLAASQTSQSALGYSVSMTYLNAGQSLYYLRNELKDLGILRQRFGGMDIYGTDQGD